MFLLEGKMAFDRVVLQVNQHPPLKAYAHVMSMCVCSVFYIYSAQRKHRHSLVDRPQRACIKILCKLI